MTEEVTQPVEEVTEAAPATPKPRKSKATPKVAPVTVQGGEDKAYRKRVVTENGSVIVYL